VTYVGEDNTNPRSKQHKNVCFYSFINQRDRT